MVAILSRGAEGKLMSYFITVITGVTDIFKSMATPFELQR